MSNYGIPPSSSYSRPWDDGIRCRDQQSAAEGPDFSTDSLETHFVRDHHLRAANGALEDDYIERLIRTSARTAEAFLHGRILIPQTWRLIMSGFPWGYIELPFAPVIEVESIAYVDGAGDDQVLAGSPAEFDVDLESGPKAGKARIYPLSGQSWPSTSTRHDAVVVTYTAGYALDDDGIATIPEDIDHGRLLVIGELYKQRSESVHAMNQNPALRSVRSLWAPYRIY